LLHYTTTKPTTGRIDPTNGHILLIITCTF